MALFKIIHFHLYSFIRISKNRELRKKENIFYLRIVTFIYLIILLAAMNLTKELFVIPSDGEFILYAPLKGTAVAVNSGIIHLLRNLSEMKTIDDALLPLVEKGIIVEKEESVIHSDIKPFKPTRITIMPSTDCNLRCVYCYGNGGLDPSYIKEEQALAGIDLIVKNAVETKTKDIFVAFHGGGEPLFLKTFDTVKNSVAYAKKEAAKFDLNLAVNSATNGVLNDAQREWVKENINSLTISFDGLPEIQDRQRPTASGEGSYHLMKKSLDFFDENKVRYFLRCTVTKDTVDRMDEIVRFVRDNTGNRYLHLEPLYECGRCATSKFKAPTSEEFTRYFSQASELGKTLGMKIVMSSGNIDGLKEKFCGAAGDNFCVTQDGFVTSCYEVMRESDQRSKIFFYGKFDETKKSFEIDQKKRDLLASRTIDNIPYCKDCFVKYHCGGECLAKAAISSDVFDPSGHQSKCDINREYLLGEIKSRLR